MIFFSFNITVKIHGDVSDQKPAHLGYLQHPVFDKEKIIGHHLIQVVQPPAEVRLKINAKFPFNHSKIEFKITHEFYNNMPPQHIIVVQITSFGCRQNSLVKCGVICFLFFYVLGIDATKLANAGNAHGIKIRAGMGAVSLKISVKLFSFKPLVSAFVWTF